MRALGETASLVRTIHGNKEHYTRHSRQPFQFPHKRLITEEGFSRQELSSSSMNPRPPLPRLTPTVNYISVLTPAPRALDTVVAALAHSETPSAREVAQQAGEAQREASDSRPAKAAVGLAAGEGLVGARVLVVAGAVVEEALDAAHAAAVLHHVLGGAHAAPVAHPEGGEGTGARALFALAPAAGLTAVGVLPGGAVASFVSARHGRGQRLQLVLLRLHPLGLGSDYTLTHHRDRKSVV